MVADTPQPHRDAGNIWVVDRFEEMQDNLRNLKNTPIDPPELLHYQIDRKQALS